MRKKRKGEPGGTGQSMDDLPNTLPKGEKAFEAELDKASKFIDALDMELTGKQLNELLKNKP